MLEWWPLWYHGTVILFNWALLRRGHVMTVNIGESCRVFFKTDLLFVCICFMLETNGFQVTRSALRSILSSFQRVFRGIRGDVGAVVFAFIRRVYACITQIMYKIGPVEWFITLLLLGTLCVVCHLPVLISTLNTYVPATKMSKYDPTSQEILFMENEVLWIISVMLFWITYVIILMADKSTTPTCRIDSWLCAHM